MTDNSKYSVDELLDSLNSLDVDPEYSVMLNDIDIDLVSGNTAAFKHSHIHEGANEYIRRLPDRIQAIVAYCKDMTEALDLSCLGRLTNLTHVYIRNAIIDASHISMLPKSIVKLHIYNTKLDNEFIEKLGHLPNLSGLFLHSVGISELTDKDITGVLSKLDYLGLSSNRFTDISIFSRLLNGIPTLQQLSLDSNNLRGCIDEDAIRNHDSIKCIGLTGTRMYPQNILSYESKTCPYLYDDKYIGIEYNVVGYSPNISSYNKEPLRETWVQVYISSLSDDTINRAIEFIETINTSDDTSVHRSALLLLDIIHSELNQRLNKKE